MNNLTFIAWKPEDGFPPPKGVICADPETMAELHARLSAADEILARDTSGEEPKDLGEWIKKYGVEP